MKIFSPRLSSISREDWLEYHPYDREVSSDHFYIRLSNDIRDEIFHIDINDSLVGADYKYLSCMLGCYFEDIISQTGIWTSFIQAHFKLYGNYLPFYDTKTDYNPGEINLVDIQFLIWHFCSNLSIHNRLIDPYSLDNEDMARIVYDRLDEESGRAPRNEDLKNALFLAPDSNIYQVTALLDFFLFKSYLNRYYMAILTEEAVIEIKNQKGVNKSNIEPLIRDKRTDLLFNAVSPLLAKRSGEILADWVGESHPLHQKLVNISKRKKGIFRYMGSSSTHLQMEHVASGLTIDVNAALDFVGASSWIPEKTVVKMGFTEWGDDLWITGIPRHVSDLEKIKPDIRENYLFAPVASQLGVVRRQEDCFFEISKGDRLIFFDHQKSVFTFVDEIWESYHRKYGADSMDRKLFDVNKLTFGTDDDSENIAVYFNSNAGPEFYPDMARCISVPRNPYFDEKAEADIEDLLFSEYISASFVAYLIENKLIETEPLLGESGYVYIWNNYDFLLRYCKKEHYKSEPEVFFAE